MASITIELLNGEVPVSLQSYGGGQAFMTPAHYEIQITSVTFLQFGYIPLFYELFCAYSHIIFTCTAKNRRISLDSPVLWGFYLSYAFRSEMKDSVSSISSTSFTRSMLAPNPASFSWKST